jgi:hypothetical protein
VVEERPTVERPDVVTDHAVPGAVRNAIRVQHDRVPSLIPELTALDPEAVGAGDIDAVVTQAFEVAVLDQDAATVLEMYAISACRLHPAWSE